MLAGFVLEGASSREASSWLSGPVSVELMFTALCVAAVAVAFIFARTSDRNPSLRLDAPSA